MGPAHGSGIFGMGWVWVGPNPTQPMILWVGSDPRPALARSPHIRACCSTRGTESAYKYLLLIPRKGFSFFLGDCCQQFLTDKTNYFLHSSPFPLFFSKEQNLCVGQTCLCPELLTETKAARFPSFLIRRPCEASPEVSLWSRGRSPGKDGSQGNGEELRWKLQWSDEIMFETKIKCVYFSLYGKVPVQVYPWASRIGGLCSVFPPLLVAFHRVGEAVGVQNGNLRFQQIKKIFFFHKTIREIRHEKLQSLLWLAKCQLNSVISGSSSGLDSWVRRDMEQRAQRLEDSSEKPWDPVNDLLIFLSGKMNQVHDIFLTSSDEYRRLSSAGVFKMFFVSQLLFRMLQFQCICKLFLSNHLMNFDFFPPFGFRHRLCSDVCENI